MHLLKASVLTLLTLALIASTSFVSFHHDQKKWLEISESFQHTFLPDEIDQYTDYLKRKTVLNSTDNTIQFNDPTLKELTLEHLSKLILLDKEYQSYILTEGHLFIDPWTLSVWKESRSQLDIEVNKLLASRLALNSNNLRFSSVLTHTLINNVDIKFGILLTGLAMSLFLLFYIMRLPHLLAALLIYQASESFLFVIASHSNDPIFLGSFGLMLCTWILCVRLVLLQKVKLSMLNGNKLLAYTALMTLLIFAFLGFAISTKTLSGLQLFVSCIASMITILAIHQSDKIEAREKLAERINHHSNKKEYRPELAKAMDFISRFEFDNAKQTLNTLAKKYPNSLTILEQRYHLAKFQPELPTYKELAEQLIELSSERNDYKRMLRLFKDVQRNTTSKQSASSLLLPEHYHKMMTVFISHNDLEKTEQAFHFLELGASDSLKADACSLLIDKFKSVQDQRKQQQYEMLLQRLG